jgi:hypothetical protein
MSVYDSLAHFGTVSMVTATLGPNDPEVGLKRIVGDEEYIFCYNAGNSQATPGDVCTVSAVSGWSITVSTVTAVDLAAGVVKHATLTTATYGWLMTRGFGQVNMDANNSVAAGGLLVCGTDGKFFNQTISTGIPSRPIGKAMAAIASGASGTAFITVW